MWRRLAQAIPHRAPAPIYGLRLSVSFPAEGAPKEMSIPRVAHGPRIPQSTGQEIWREMSWVHVMVISPLCGSMVIDILESFSLYSPTRDLPFAVFRTTVTLFPTGVSVTLGVLERTTMGPLARSDVRNEVFGYRSASFLALWL